MPNTNWVKKKVNEKKSIIQEKRENKIRNLSSYVKKNISFAEALKNKTPKKPTDTFSQKNPPIGEVDSTPFSEETNSSLYSSVNNLLNEFKNQILELLQKQQKQLNNLNKLIGNTESKTNYVLNIIDSLLPQND